MQAEFIYNANNYGLGAHAPSIVMLPDRTLLVAWYAYKGDYDYKEGKLQYSIKPNNKAWNTTAPLFDSIQSSLGNPVLYFDPDLSLLNLLFVQIHGNYWTDTVAYHAHSENLGTTWSTPRRLGTETGIMIRNPPIFHKGMILLPAYDERQNKSLIINIKNNCRILYLFETESIIQPAIASTESDTLLSLFRTTREEDYIWKSFSNTSGKTWSSPIKTHLPCPLSAICTFTVNKKLFVVYNHSSKRERTPLSIAASNDHGLSWSQPLTIDNSAPELSYPCFIYDGDRTVHGVYTYNRRMIKYVQLDFAELP